MRRFFELAYQKAELVFSLTYVRHLLLVTALFALAFYIQHSTYLNAQDKAVGMVKLLKYYAIFPDSLMTKKNDYRAVLVQKKLSENFRYVTLSLPATANCKIERIYQQLTDVTLRAHNHLQVTKEFMLQSYVCNSAAAVFFVLSGLALAFITKAGFANANPYFITLFITSLGLGSFFVSLTNIFKQEHNAKENAALYIKYLNLEQAIRTELITNKKIISSMGSRCDTLTKKVDDVDRAILFFDKEMREINQVALGFDSEVVKSLTDLGANAKLDPK